MNDKIVKLFTGTLMDANYLVPILKENNIDSFVRDFQQESLIAGWVGGISDDSVSIYVSNDDFDAANQIVNEYQSFQSNEDNHFDE